MKKNRSFRKFVAASLSAALTAGYIPMSVPAYSASETVKSEEKPAVTTTAVSSKPKTETTTKTETKKADTKETAETAKTPEKKPAEQPQEKFCNIELKLSGEGRILADGEERSGIKAKAGDRVVITVELPEEGSFRFDSLSIDGEEAEAEKKDEKTYTYEYEVPEDPAENVCFSAVTTPAYTVSVKQEADKGIVVTPEDDGETEKMGELVVESDEKVIAQPLESFYVSDVFIDGVKLEKDEINVSEDRSVELNIEKDKEFDVVFAPITYSITSEECENGRIEISSNSADYNGEVQVTVKPNTNCYIQKILIDGMYFDPNAGIYIDKYTVNEYSNGTFKISGIKSDVKISAEFVRVKALTYDDFNIVPVNGIKHGDRNFKAAHNGGSVNFSVKREGDNITFPADKCGIELYDANNNVIAKCDNYNKVEVRSDAEIAAIKVFYEDNGYSGRFNQTVDLSDNPVTVDFVDEIVLDLTPEEAGNPYNVYGGETVKVKWDASNLLGNDINSIIYWFNDELESEAVAIMPDKTDGNKSVFTAENHYIPIDTSKYNGKDVKLHVKAFSNTGANVLKTVTLCIAPEKPEIISIEQNKELEGAEPGWFEGEREIVFKIKDRSYAQVENKDFFQIDNKGVFLSSKDKDDYISIERTGDIITYKLKITDEGKFGWQFNYKNKAGNTAVLKDADLQPPPYFTVRSTKNDIENCYFKVNNEKRTDISDILKFGLFENKKVDLNLIVSQKYFVKEVAFYKEDYNGEKNLYSSKIDKAEKIKELETLYNEGKFEVSDGNDYSYSLDDSTKSVVYARILFNTGATKYISSDGIILDSTLPDNIKVNFNVDEKDIFVDEDNKPVYFGEVPVSIRVTDPAKGDEAVSGIKKISCYVQKKDYSTSTTVDIFKWNPDSKDAKIVTDITADYTITDDKFFNDSDLKLVVVVFDNAGNKYQYISGPFDINLDKTQLSMVLDNNSSNSINYYNKRSAKVKFNFTGKNARLNFDKERAEKAIFDYIKFTPLKGNSNENAIRLSDWEISDHDASAIVYFEGEGYYQLANKGQFDYVDKQERQLDTFIVQGDNTSGFYIDSSAPEGSITIEENVWTDLLDTITFGLFKSAKNDNPGYSAFIKGTDNSPSFKIEYFISNSDKVYTKDELDKFGENTWIVYKDDVKAIDRKEAIKFDSPGKYVIYVKMSDFAGNVRYLCSNGHIIDNSESKIDLTVDEPFSWRQEDGRNVPVYNSDFKEVNVKVECKETENDYSGVDQIKYWFETTDKNYSLPDEGKEYTLYSSEDGERSNDITKTIRIDTAAYNRSDLELHVYTIDKAGNENEAVQKLDIDVTQPTVKIEYLNDDDNKIVVDGDDTYFNNSRRARITIVERSSHFNADSASSSIRIKAVNNRNEELAQAMPFIGEWVTVPDPVDSDKDVHTLEISFTQSAIYDFDVDYVNTVDNKRGDIVVPDGTQAPFRFIVDNEKPTGKLHIQTAENHYQFFEDLKSSVSYTMLSKDWVKAWCDKADEISPVTEVQYFKSSRTTAYTAEELDNVTEWQNFDEFIIRPNEQAVVYAKIADKAGNVKYISSDGIIVDNITPHAELDAPVITIAAKQDTDGIYNGDVNVKIKVEEPSSNGVYSGLQHIEYSVTNMGQITEGNEHLHDFNVPFPDLDQMETRFEQEIVINAENNNSNDVVLRVEATDRAGNTSVQELPLKIDTTAPSLGVTYSDTRTNKASDSYYTSRTATFTINERNFDSRNVSITVYKDNVYMPVNLEWSESGNSNSPANGDGRVYTATLPFTADGAYRYEMSFVDMAGNNSAALNEGTFVVDATPPDVRLNFNRNNNNSNDNKSGGSGNFYNAPRELSITIDERNFSDNNVNLSITKTFDGQKLTPPAIEGWQKTAGGRTTKIRFDEDGDYSIKLRVTDEAGNANSDAKNNDSEFTIDTKDPEVELTVNGQKITDTDLNGAYSGKVIPEIKYSDVNLDPDSVKISLSAANVEVSAAEINEDSVSFDLKDKNGKTVTWSGTVENVLSANGNVIGRKIVMDDFPESAAMKDFDDIYTFKVSAADKAKRKTTNQMTFSVNRFGSTYDISSIGNIVGKYIKEPVDVSITEYNANKLKNVKLTVYRNNEANVLKEDEDFHVVSEGGEGKWYKYAYNIPKEYFEDDGVYKISVRSLDSANNISENSLESKGKEISFGIDSESPKIIPVNIASDKTYAEDKMDFIFTVSDNLNVEEVSAVLDDNQPVVWKDEELKKVISGNGEFMITVDGDSNQAHTLKLICKDSAGNISESVFDDFYVTTNLAVRFLHNKGILAGAAGIIAALIGGVIVFFRKKRS